MNKVKMLSDVVAEVRKEAPEDVPNWSKRYEEAKQNLQNQIMKGRMLPRGVEDHPLADFGFNYSVQRDVRAGHVMNIMRKFDPRVCCPVVLLNGLIPTHCTYSMVSTEQLHWHS